MPSIYRHALLPYSARQMYDIVNGVEEYPAFLPWCARGEVLDQGEEFMEARILMQKGRLNHAFSTRNTMVTGKRIHIELVNGPFRRLVGDWTFSEMSGTGCKIELQMEFEFSSKIVGTLIGPIFTQIANSLVDAFCQRAHQLYRQDAPNAP